MWGRITADIKSKIGYIVVFEGSEPVRKLPLGKTIKEVRDAITSTYTTYGNMNIHADTMMDTSDIPEQMNKKNRLLGKKFLLDPGHSKQHPGATGVSPDYPREEDHCRHQASILKGLLEQEGASVEVYDPPSDILSDIGKRANGKDMFLSLHLNALNKKDHYTCVMVHKSLASENSKKFAKIAADKIAEKLNHKQSRVGNGNPDGVYPAYLGVLKAAELTNCPCCVLTESFFIDAYGSNEIVRNKTEMAAQAIYEGILEYYGVKNENPPSVPNPTPPSKPEPEYYYSVGKHGKETLSKAFKGQLTKNFSADEFKCSCSDCSSFVIDHDHVNKLQALRDSVGAIHITSAYRCPSHNAAVGGVPNSRHLKGDATDIYSATLSSYSLAGKCKHFDGLGRYNTFVHVDSRGYRARW